MFHKDCTVFPNIGLWNINTVIISTRICSQHQHQINLPQQEGLLWGKEQTQKLTCPHHYSPFATSLGMNDSAKMGHCDMVPIGTALEKCGNSRGKSWVWTNGISSHLAQVMKTLCIFSRDAGKLIYCLFQDSLTVNKMCLVITI